MEILIVRHGKAEERALHRGDAGRRLTPAGRRDMARVAKGIADLVPRLAVIATSPLVRAQETAAILARRYDGMNVAELSALAPGAAPAAIAEWLGDQPADAVIALVGHEPDLGLLASYLVSGAKRSFMPLKKAGACLIECGGAPVPGAGQLRWMLPPKVLRALA
jgi:phosphohistidine phosphatase